MAIAGVGVTWKADTRPEVVRTFEHSTLTPERDGTETAHLIAFADGRQLRVLPDGRNNGHMRARVVRGGLEVLDNLIAKSGDLIDPLVYMRGVLAGVKFDWEEPLAELTVEEWFDRWLRMVGLTDEGMASQLLSDLAVDGWVVVRER